MPATQPEIRTHAHLGALAQSLLAEHHLDAAVVVGTFPVATERQFASALPDAVRFPGPHHPGTGQQALSDRFGTFPPNTLYVLGPNGTDPAFVGQCLYLLPRGEGVLLLPLGDADGPHALLPVHDQLQLWCPGHRARVVTTADGQRHLVVQPQRTVHVTFLMERYSFRYGTSGPSINWDNLVATLQTTGLASHSTVLHDEYQHHGRSFTAADFAAPAGVDDHVLVCTYDHHNEANPPLALLRQAQARGTRIVYVWLDKRIIHHRAGYADLADVNVVLDCTDFELPRAWPSFTPKNPIHYNDPGLARTIDLSVLGEMRFLKQRKDLLPRLRAERRLAIHAPGSSATSPQRRLDLDEYTRIYKTSKVSLVLTKDRVHQLKGRIFEVTLCGALLLCDRNPYIDRFFTPFREYVPFDDYDDLIALCRYYLDHDDERAAIARAGCAKATRFYNARVFWTALFARVFGTPAAGVASHA